MALFTQEGNILGATATVIDFTTVAGPGDNHKSASLKNDHATSVITGVLDSQTFTVLPGEERALTGIQVNSRLSLTAVVNPTAFRFAMSSAFEPPKIGTTPIPTVTTANIAAGAVTYAREQPGAVAVLADSAAPLLAAALVSGIVNGALTAPRAKFTDTAAAIVAAVPGAIVGTMFDCVIAPNGANDLTITPVAGVTFLGTAARLVYQAQGRRFRFILTNVTGGAETVSFVDG